MISPTGCGVLLLGPVIAGVIVGAVIAVTRRGPAPVVQSKKSVFRVIGKVFCLTAMAWLFHKAITFDRNRGAGPRG